MYLYMYMYEYTLMYIYSYTLKMYIIQIYEMYMLPYHTYMYLLSSQYHPTHVGRALSSTTTSLVSTNTRQLGVKKTIELTRGTKGTFGFGLASRDVATNTEEIPIYVKSISSGGPAFQDGRLRIGDRVLEVGRGSIIMYMYMYCTDIYCTVIWEIFHS